MEHGVFHVEPRKIFVYGISLRDIREWAVFFSSAIALRTNQLRAEKVCVCVCVCVCVYVYVCVSVCMCVCVCVCIVTQQ